MAEAVSLSSLAASNFLPGPIPIAAKRFSASRSAGIRFYMIKQEVDVSDERRTFGQLLMPRRKFDLRRRRRGFLGQIGA